ncbi:MAG: hypothetical protein KBE02_04350 [Sulfurospirillum sp.]|nr:hypothetical protein [Sulfurospirillum sp.]
MGRSEAEISRGCEEIGYKKGTKAHKECVESIMEYERQHERDEQERQREEAEKRKNRT